MPITRTLAERVAMLARLLRLPAAAPPPRALGVHDGRLSPCRNPRNCVSSYAGDGDALPPLPGGRGRDETMRRLRAILASEPGAQVVEERGDYLRAEFTTRLWRFVDDVELLWDDAEGVVHFRSASRIGRADLGTNRRRMRHLADRFAAED